MNNLRLFAGVCALMPFAILLSYFLPFDFVEACIIAVLVCGLVAIPMLLLVFAVSAIAGAFNGGRRHR